MYRHSGAGSAFTASRQPLHTRVTRGTSGSAPITSRGAHARLTILLRARGEADDEDESDASDSATIEKILSNISEGKSPQSAPTRHAAAVTSARVSLLPQEARATRRQRLVLRGGGGGTRWWRHLSLSRSLVVVFFS